LEPALAQPKTWVLRDYHSPNLIWLPERRGLGCLGLIDFQDALLGPAAYDLASLLQDARVDVPEALELDLMGRYVRARSIADASFDVPQFAMIYATLAAQRASKILGIFTRLNRRDRKPQYLRHIRPACGAICNARSGTRHSVSSRPGTTSMSRRRIPNGSPNSTSRSC
jgi:Predicted phosphotransferase related to Ser/Thr protein kinases